MDMLIDDSVGNFEFYCETTSTTSSSSSDGRNWGDWSPLVDWDSLRGCGNQDFHGLIDSLIDHGAGNFHSEGYTSNSLSPDTNMIDVDDEPETEPETETDDSKGLRLIHLLIAAAEALAGANKSRDLARVILVRLKELAASPADGSNMERLAAYFTDALYSLLEGTSGPNGKRVVLHTGGIYNRDPDVLAAFQLLQDMSPYVKFGHFTANQAILESVANDRRVHIIDYDIMEGIQWPSLMQALVSRKDNPPPNHLRITAIAHGGSTARRSIGTVQETGRRLVSFAASIGLPFSFHQCRLDSDDGFRPSSVKLVKGEALVVNCMLHLPHFNYRSWKSVGSFLSGAKTLNPKTMTMVEEEMGAGGGDVGGFVGRFVDSLHHYSALYDSLEGGLLPVRGQSAASRALVERVFMGPRIVATVARIYRSGSSEEEEFSGSGSWLMGMGYKPVGISFSNHCQAKLLVGLFNDGYGVEELGKNRLTLGWKSKRLLSASLWTS